MTRGSDNKIRKPIGGRVPSQPSAPHKVRRCRAGFSPTLTKRGGAARVFHPTHTKCGGVARVFPQPLQSTEVSRGFFTQDLPCAKQSQQGRKGSRDKGCEACVEIKPRIAEFHDLGDYGLGDE